MLRLNELKKTHNACLMVGLSILTAGSAVGLYRLYQKAMVEQTLAKQLQTNVFELSRSRQNVESTKQLEEEEKRKQQKEAEAEERYFAEIPLVISTLDGKGRLVGFSRLKDNNGSAQYSFIIKHDDKYETVTGTIVNQGGKYTYTDDYSTSSDVRTSGEITHSRPNSRRLRIDFVVTGSPSDKYRVGDTFFATFVLPSDGSSL